jgi:D-glycero-alpha-D-manno-heptose-7-phosphate kinase
MGSSSAFTVGLLHALYALKGKLVSKRQLAMESIHVEQDLIRETVGSQDQVCAAFGGVNLIEFARNGEVTVHPITLAPERLKLLNDHLLLFYTGIKRTASDIAASYVQGMDGRKQQLELMSQLLNQSLEVLKSDTSLLEFGELLHESWQAKRSLSDKVSNSRIDELYDAARSAGAIGGKLLGAGGGGFLLLFVPPEDHSHVKAKLSRLIHVPFEFEFSGSQIIFFDLEEDYAEHDRARSQQEIEAFREMD